jgi:hypothetical protein
MPRTTFALCALALLLALPAAVHSAAPAGDGAPDPNRTRPGPYRPLPLTVLAIDKESIRVRTRTTDAKELTFGIDPKITKVFAGVVTAEQTNEQGNLVRRVKIEPAALSDLEVGRDVYVASNADDVAVDIILPPKPPAKNGDKAKEKQRGEKK